MNTKKLRKILTGLAITVIGTIIAGYICSRLIKTGPPPVLEGVSFTVEEPVAAPNDKAIPIAQGGISTSFSGKCANYTAVSAKGCSIYPIVKDPSGTYWPNREIRPQLNGNWNTNIWIGNKKDKKGDRFDLFFVLVWSNSSLASKLFEDANSHGLSNLGLNLPSRATVLCQAQVVLDGP